MRGGPSRALVPHQKLNFVSTEAAEAREKRRLNMTHSARTMHATAHDSR